MPKILITFSLLILLFSLLALPAHAAEKIAGASAALGIEKESTHASSEEQTSYIIKKEAIKKVLERNNSPLASSVDSFIETCKTYRIDCYLLPAIAGLESSFGKYTSQGSYNPFGWGGGFIIFADWDEAIFSVGKGLRNNYMDKGATSIEAIGTVYAASPTWAVRINSFIQQFREEESHIPLFLEENAI